MVFSTYAMIAKLLLLGCRIITLKDWFVEKGSKMKMAVLLSLKLHFFIFIGSELHTRRNKMVDGINVSLASM